MHRPDSIPIELEIPITLIERDGIKRIQEPVTFGIPFPKSSIWACELLQVVDELGNVVPCAITPSSFWSDNSLQWLLMDCQFTISPREQKKYILKASSHPHSELPAFPLAVEETEKHFIIQSGGTEFKIDKKHFSPLPAVRFLDSGLTILDNSQFLLTDATGVQWFPHMAKCTIESSNLFRAVVYCEGLFSSSDPAGNNPLDFSSRITFWAGHNTVSLEFTIHNPNAARHPGGLWDLGDEGSFFFKSLDFECFMPSGGSYTTVYKSEMSGDERSGNDICIYQDSSGGSNWNFRNHVNCRGEIKTSFRGYRIFESGQLIGQGLRAEPVLSLCDGHSTITAAIRNFWQNCPSAIESRGNCLKISLFPARYADLFELQGGEQKTHQIFFRFGLASDPLDTMSICQRPLVAFASPEWCCASTVFPHFIAKSQIPDRFPYKQCYEMIETAIKGDNSLFQRREFIDEYGWRNFGEIYADHENLLYSGEKPIVSHYNNQYDLINSFLKQFLRSGDLDWYILAEQLAKHVMDIDIYHTERDRCEYNKGLFWHTDHYCDAATSSHRSYSRHTMAARKLSSYGGGPSCQHVYSQGLLNYFYMTGDPKAKQSVLDFASFIISNIDGPQMPIGILKEIARDIFYWLHKKIKPKVEAFGLLEGPGRASGNALSVLLDAHQLTRDKAYLFKAEYLIRCCIHPSDDLASKSLNDVNMRWPYTIFLQSLGKYLDIKAERGECDEMYFYGRQSLLHYAKWMLQNEVPFLDRREELDFPNHATRAATDVRKACVLIEASRYCDQPLKISFRDKAREFFCRSIQDISTLDSSSYARPLAILMQNMDLPLWDSLNIDEKYLEMCNKLNFGSPLQGTSFHRLLRDNARLLKRLLASSFGDRNINQ
ncbi:MAG: hypothetical protein JXA73_06975 [Acidobacteria bacterium]|nr:hypothetical protein [Acidobacteriota bacterium]